MTWPALNFGWARNAVLPGMHPQVQQATRVAAQIAAEMPELVTAPVAVATPTPTAT